MAQYASVMLEYASIWLNVPQYSWTCWLLLNMPENAWTNCCNYARALNMPDHLDIWQGFEYAPCIKYTKVLNILRYSYNNIIITNVILEFLFPQFVYPGAPQLNQFTLFWHQLEDIRLKIEIEEAEDFLTGNLLFIYFSRNQ